MKVLFAVHDEKVSSSIVKKYQKEYKEIISYKNVYYFNAILKELQRDKTYDRIVIDEELEEFTSSSYEQKDKFIFDKLDSITDEASKFNGNDMPIILICSERRVKSEEILVKLFGIGIYNAIIGNDRSTDEVCRLINKPRTKKEAKIYYNIDSEDVSYKHENEDDVSEEEMQHILSYFKKLGKNEDRYVECFKNIVSQYNDKQMRIIISILPLHIRSILEEKSPEYQKIVARGGGKFIPPRANASNKEVKGTSEKLLNKESHANTGKPIVIPSKLDKTLIKKISIKKPAAIATKKIEEEPEDVDTELEDLGEVAQAPRKRGRPKKIQEEGVTEDIEVASAPKRRGRPRKKPLPEEIEEQEPEKEEILPEIEYETEEEKEKEKETFLPGLDDEDNGNDLEQENEENFLPGIEDDEEEEYENDQYEEYDDEDEDEDNERESILPGVGESNNQYNGYLEQSDDYYQDYDFTEYNSLLSSSRKVIAFVGTSKNGTSFIVNNIAEILSNSGIDTAILDTTQNKNAYYIYTKNDESLRRTAADSIEHLIRGKTEGVQVNNNLTVYTELPNQGYRIKSVGPILENLIKSYSAVLIDCDFNTPIEYFKNVQEIYLVQSMDVLTIQPLTAFLRELKAKDVLLDESKIKIIINKAVKVKGVTDKTIVGGMAYYNDPEMSFMTELFDRNAITPIEIPFDLEVYKNYLEQIIECKISTEKYPKEFQSVLKDLAYVVYPLLPAKKSKEKRKKGYPYEATSKYSNNGFSNSVNNTLNNMKKRY